MGNLSFKCHAQGIACFACYHVYRYLTGEFMETDAHPTT